MGSGARAQEAEPREIVVVCEGADCAQIDLDRVRARVGAETGVEVHVATDPSARGATLHIRIEGDVRVVLVLARADGSQMERTTELPDEPSERAETLAILAVNMFRDESAELLALLRATPPDTTGATPDAPAETDTVETVETVEVETVEAPSTTPVTPLPPVAPPRAPFLRLGLAAQLGSTPRSGGAAFDFIAGLEISWTPLPYFALGMRDLGGGGSLPGPASHVDGSPFAELGLALSFVTLYADLGAHLQLIVDGVHDGVSAIGVAPFVVLGVRFRLAPEVSLGAETAIRVVATDAFFSGLYELPQLAVPWTGGLSLLFHVS